MCETWMDWLGVIASITTIIAFLMYLRERRKRKDQDNVMLGFLHGIKPIIEGAGLQLVVKQINDMLSRLQPPKTKS